MDKFINFLILVSVRSRKREYDLKSISKKFIDAYPEAEIKHHLLYKDPPGISNIAGRELFRVFIRLPKEQAHYVYDFIEDVSTKITQASCVVECVF